MENERDVWQPDYPQTLVGIPNFSLSSPQVICVLELQVHLNLSTPNYCHVRGLPEPLRR